MVPKPRVLIVEDEPELGELLDQAFRESGYAPKLVRNGRDGLRHAVGHDVLVVDVMMPVLNGFDMVRTLRSTACRIPVIFLTAKDAICDRVEGLQLGGDDYLLKPFALEELFARVEALLRRARSGCDLLSYADLRIDRRERLVYRGEDTIALSNTEFGLLEAFLLSPEVPLSKATLLRDVWHDEAVRDENIVEVYVGYLRAKTETRGRTRLLHTVRGQGYVLERR
ncbi:response regulator transcription factor [bacterium]|nr:MAG: response regulator transcription factor [bacterium]